MKTFRRLANEFCYFYMICKTLGWPQLQWFVTEHLSKPPKDWLPPPRPSDNAPAYIEVMFHVWFVYNCFALLKQNCRLNHI